MVATIVNVMHRHISRLDLQLAAESALWAIAKDGGDDANSALLAEGAVEAVSAAALAHQDCDELRQRAAGPWRTILEGVVAAGTAAEGTADAEEEATTTASESEDRRSQDEGSGTGEADRKRAPAADMSGALEGDVDVEL